MARSGKSRKHKQRASSTRPTVERRPQPEQLARPRRFPWYAAVGTVVGSLAVALVLAELTLRLIGFEYQLRMTVIRNTAPDPEGVLENFEIDPDLLWVPEGYRARLEAAVADPPAVVFMGDSCTQIGRYHEYLMPGLTRRQGVDELPWVNLGVAGWTSVQGLAQMKRDVALLEPAVVTLYFGWNDHWLSIGVEDREAIRIAKMPLFRYQLLRLVQLALKSYVAVNAETDPRPVRVPLDTFGETLMELVRTARSFGAVPVLLTAPSAHAPDYLPDYLEGRWIDDVDQLVPLHQSYVDKVREVARDTGAVLCDLAAAFDQETVTAKRERYFLPDGIHLRDAGDRRMAFHLYRCFEKHDLISELGDGER